MKGGIRDQNNFIRALFEYQGNNYIVVKTNKKPLF
jgi:hypothetical protein